MAQESLQQSRSVRRTVQTFRLLSGRLGAAFVDELGHSALVSVEIQHDLLSGDIQSAAKRLARWERSAELDVEDVARLFGRVERRWTDFATAAILRIVEIGELPRYR